MTRWRKVIPLLALPALLLTAGTSGKGDLTPSSATEVYQAGQRAAKEGRLDSAIVAYEAAAKRGVLGAQLALARIYSTGDGAPRNDAVAFKYYSKIAELYGDIDPYHPLATYIAEAYRSTANYLKSGIAEIGLKPNPVEAARLMLQAASYLHDGKAQYELALMYMNGEGVERNPRLAVTWLANASSKRHAPAQAVLGDMLWRGRDVKRSATEGLAMLALARDNATPEDLKWIDPIYQNAVNEADNAALSAADKLLVTLSPTYRIKSDGVLRFLPAEIAPQQIAQDAPTASDDVGSQGTIRPAMGIGGR